MIFPPRLRLGTAPNAIADLTWPTRQRSHGGRLVGRGDLELADRARGPAQHASGRRILDLTPGRTTAYSAPTRTPFEVPTLIVSSLPETSATSPEIAATVS